MSSIPIYIKSISISNIKTFVEEVELCLTRPDGTIPQWTLLLGDNGIGKSTLLQLIAWMKPNTSDYKPAPLLDAEENEVLEHLVHKSIGENSTAIANAVFVANQKLDKKATSAISRCETKMTIVLDESGRLKRVTGLLKANKRGIFYKEEVTIYAYSASRQLGKLNINNKGLSDMIPSFIQEKTELYDAEEILHTIHYASLALQSEEEKEKYSKLLEFVKNMMVALLPDFEKIQDIEISPPRVLGDSSAGGIMINTRHGNKIPFSDFSLGYKSVASWTIDLAWRLFTNHQDSKNPLAEPAIVLIDEIDLHLHPLWQQRIMASLSDHFPHVQFIASAHSPLMVQAAVRSNYAVLRFEEGSVKIENRPEGIDGWRVDQILTSEFFDLKSARGLEYDELMTQREALLHKKTLTEKDKTELAALNLKLFNLPTGETPEELSNREFISHLVNKIKLNKQ